MMAKVDEIANILDLEPIGLDFKHDGVKVVDPGDTTSHRGHSLKLSAEVVKTIVVNLATGSTITVAARAAGVARKTFYEWMEIGRRIFDSLDELEEDEIAELDPHQHMMLYLFEMVQMAEAGAELQLLQLVLKEGGPGAKWVLQRRFPERWAHKQVQQVQHTGEIKLDWGQPSDLELADIVEGEFTDGSGTDDVREHEQLSLASPGQLNGHGADDGDSDQAIQGGVGDDQREDWRVLAQSLIEEA